MQPYRGGHNRDLKTPSLRADERVRARMRAQRERDTAMERQIRSRLHAMGLRFRLHQRLLTGLRREADVVFARARVAVFIDGCFWHGCPEHGTWPKNNAVFWRRKLRANATRDRDTDARLAADGWVVVRVWEHERADQAAIRIAEVVAARAT